MMAGPGSRRAGQHGPFSFSLECGQLQPQRHILKRREGVHHVVGYYASAGSTDSTLSGLYRIYAEAPAPENMEGGCPFSRWLLAA
jgi:hypothetical protein